MKVKASLDKRAIQQFLLLHSEKIVVAVVGICFLLMVYKAFSRESFDQTPESLIQAANKAEDHMQKDTDLANVDKNFPPIREDSWEQVPVKEDDYKWPQRLTPPLAETRGLRQEPPVLNVEDLRGSPGIGAFSVAKPATPDATATAIPGRRWVVLTAKVPRKKQIAAYDEYFKGAQGYEAQRDVPVYVSCRVERAELPAHGAAGGLQWTALDPQAERQKALDSWAGRGDEVVGESYIIDPLVFPLGPRLASGATSTSQATAAARSAWGEEVAYPPDIPLLRQPSAAASAGPAAAAAKAATAAAPTADIPDFPFGLAPNAAPHTPAAAPAEDKDPEFQLFRFFDFSVEPGKKYRYRVRLILENPNDGNANNRVDERYLDKTVLDKKNRIVAAARQLWREGKQNEATELYRDQWQNMETPSWSNVTDVSVPRDTRTLAVSVKPPLRTASEPSGRMMLVKFDMLSGREVKEEFSVYRGKVLNFTDRTASTKQPKKDRDKDDKLPDLGPRQQPQLAAPAPSDYVTDTLVVDMRGGQHLSRKDRTTVPGALLLLDPDGALVLHDELEDQKEVSAYQQSAAPPGPAAPGAPQAPEPRKGPTTEPGHRSPATTGNLQELHSPKSKRTPQQTGAAKKP